MTQSRTSGDLEQAVVDDMLAEEMDRLALPATAGMAEP
jgi:hypothetical protein